MLNAKNPQTIRKESSAEYFSFTALQRNLHHIVSVMIVYISVTVIITGFSILVTAFPVYLLSFFCFSFKF